MTQEQLVAAAKATEPDSRTVRFFVPVKTPNPLNGSGIGGHAMGVRMAAESLRRKQRRMSYDQAIHALRGVGHATRAIWVPAKMRKGVEVRPGFSREVASPIAGWWVVELARLGRGLLDSHDALPAALKSVVDGIADALGVNDGDGRKVSWRYSQRRDQVRTGVEVTVSQQERRS